MSAYHQHARRRIDSIESLREHLQWAVEIEHSTLPPYLCALCSLDPARDPAAVEVVTSVFVEEMLHLTLAANRGTQLCARVDPAARPAEHLAYSNWPRALRIGALIRSKRSIAS